MVEQEIYENGDVKITEYISEEHGTFNRRITVGNFASLDFMGDDWEHLKELIAAFIEADNEPDGPYDVQIIEPVDPWYIKYERAD